MKIERRRLHPVFRFAGLGRWLRRLGARRYRPERHYMRGPSGGR